jgi:PAS domain S-box-containing protein
MEDLPVANTLADWGDAANWWGNFFDSSEDALMVCRIDGIAQHINPKAARRFRLKPETDDGFLSVPNLLSAPADKRLLQILQRPAANTLQSAIIQRDGVPYSLMDLEVTPLGDGYSLVTFRDSSRRLRLEAHVQRLVTAIDATPDVFLITDADFRITFVNPAFQSATGYSLEEVLGQTDDFLRVQAEHDKIRTYRERVLAGREWIGELVNMRRNGEVYHAECTVTPITDIAGQFMGYVVCERDITVRRHLQTALRSERDFVQSILHSLDGAIYSLDCEFRVTHANAGWRQFPAEHGGINFSGPPLLGLSLLDFVPDTGRRAELRQAFEEVIGNGRPQENHFHSVDGRHWLTRISPWVDGEKVRGLICTITDQTQYHELQAQLFQAQKMEIIGTLAAGVAHDFNNLLQAIRGHASLALMQAEPESPLRRGLEKIDAAAIRASDVTQQLLSFSRATEDKRTLLDLNATVRETAQLARRTLRGDISVELHPAAEPVPVRMDSSRASQALLNLIINAQDAMPDGGQLTLSNAIVLPPAALAAERCLPPGKTYARCSVKDTGCGIAPEVLPKIFQPFFTSKPEGRGTGLGLAIVQRVAHEAGGFIEVETQVGKGTTFHIYLPLAQEPLVAAVPKSEGAPVPRNTGRVLVVDDVDLLRDFAQGFLEMSGLTVLTASGGQQAIEILKECEPVDLVFTDFNMPGMNGVELIEHIAARWPQIKFILASGYLDDETRARIERCKATVLSKPYDMHDASKIVLEKIAGK